MHELMKRVQIALSIPPSLPMLGHDGLGFNRDPDRRRLHLGDPGIHGDNRRSRGRAQDQVNVPLAASDNDLAVVVIDQAPLSGVLGYSRAGIEEIFQNDRAEKLAVLV
ncbi:MAG: hypothetical protein ACREKQ_03170 [Candidatus Rokuibacteriota bacterium]